MHTTRMEHSRHIITLANVHTARLTALHTSRSNGRTTSALRSCAVVRGPAVIRALVGCLAFVPGRRLLHVQIHLSADWLQCLLGGFAPHWRRACLYGIRARRSS